MRGVVIEMAEFALERWAAAEAVRTDGAKTAAERLMSAES